MLTTGPLVMKERREGMPSIRKFLVLSVTAQISSAGCVGVWAGKPPACPPPSHDAVDQLLVVQQSAVAPGLVGWVGEIERYCSGIDSMRGN